jgi:tRNA(Ile)-lysidine synthase
MPRRREGCGREQGQYRRRKAVGGVAPLVDRVGQALRRLAVPAGPMVVAVSGGPDSVALALALADQPARTGPLVLAHFNHRLRGAASDGDEAFVRAWHAGLVDRGRTDLRLCCGQADVRAQAAAEHDNLESVARRLRYDWLRGVAREVGVRFVATGHTADDQAETVLHRLLRGTGLRGLRGIAARRPLGDGVEVVRPLLTVAKADVLAYLRAAGQDFRQDASNADCNFTRNRIRHELLPHLAERYNPAVAAVLGRLAEQAAEAYREDEARARALLAEAELPRAGTLLVFDRRRLSAASRHCVREALRLAWEREGWPSGAMGFAEWERLAAVAFGEKTVDELPGRICVRSSSRVVRIGPVP